MGLVAGMGFCRVGNDAVGWPSMMMHGLYWRLCADSTVAMKYPIWLATSPTMLGNDGYPARFCPYHARFDPYPARFCPYHARYDPYAARFCPCHASDQHHCHPEVRNGAGHGCGGTGSLGWGVRERGGSRGKPLTSSQPHFLAQVLQRSAGSKPPKKGERG